MSAPWVENPIADSVSISCSCCTFQDYGKFVALEPVAQRHAKDTGHPVRLTLGFMDVGIWKADGSFKRSGECNPKDWAA